MKQFILGALLILGLAMAVAPVAFAADTCGGVNTAVLHCDQTGKGGIEDSGVWGILLVAINILTAGIGIVAIAGIVYASILYTSAGGDAAQTKKSIELITNIVIGVLAYALMYAGLNFLIPGGIFS